MKKDNAGLQDKLKLRRRALSYVEGDLLPLEVFAGAGTVGRELYREADRGTAFEKDPAKTERLARDRPAWRVYEGDAIVLTAAAAFFPGTNYVDVDPYGDPHPAIAAVFEAAAHLADHFVLAVNDGLRQYVRMGKAWSGTSLQGIVAQYGTNLWAVYLDVCKRLVTEKAGEASYRLTRFEGFYAGHARQMTHYYAVLQKTEAPS